MHPGKTLSQALAETPAAALISRCERADQAARLVTAAFADLSPLPAEIPAIHCQIREHLLLVFVPSAAQAAKLRQALPRLQAILQAHGLNLSEIRVRVQPSPSAETDSGGSSTRIFAASTATRQAPPVEFALQFADKLVLTLRPSPLRDTAERLAQGLRSRRTK